MESVPTAAFACRPLELSPLFSSHILFSSERSPAENTMLADSSLELSKSKPRALVVDDAPDVVEMIAMFLQHAGFDPVMVYSGFEALETARAEHFDVVVSDIGMPGMNGYELAQALRTLPDYEETPMIAVTGFAMYDDRDRALESGFNAYMTKPINPMTLLDLIRGLRSS